MGNMKKNLTIADLKLNQIGYRAIFHNGTGGGGSYTTTNFRFVEVNQGGYCGTLLVEDNYYIRDNYNGKFSIKKNSEVDYNDWIIYLSKKEAEKAAYDNHFQFESNRSLKEIKKAEEEIKRQQNHIKYKKEQLEALGKEFGKDGNNCILCKK